MCGFAGYLNLSTKSFITNQTLLHELQQELAHRGPDGYRTWSSPQHELALVHRRLSIIDLTDAGAQPMFDRDRTVVICANGEIYNHQQLRRELETLGYCFDSSCDSEVLIYGYKAWGIDRLLERLEGMFAFSLYDFKTQELFLVRDRIGVKPLYFSLQGDICSFASEIKALWKLPWINKQISASSVYHYVTYLVTPAPLTLFENVYKLPAGFYLRFDKQKTMHIKQWYKLHEQLVVHDNKYDEQWYVEKIRSLLRASVKKRMMSDVPFGVFLSGGIDSSLNVALMSEFTDKVKTFTVAFQDGPEYNELAWARKVAHLYDTDHHEIIINEHDAHQFFDSMVYYQDEPLGDCVCVPLYFVSKLLKEKGVTVVQVGEGSDELFCGYDQYVNYLNSYCWWSTSQNYVPKFAKKGLFYAAQRMFPDKYGKLDILNNWACNRELFYSGAVVFSEHMKHQMLKMSAGQSDPIVERFFPGMQLDDSYAMADWYRAQLKKQLPQADQLTQMGYLELKHRLPELLLMRVDKMSMATAVEARVPFLDHKFVEFALTIPQDLKYHNGVTKYILKKAAEGLLPHDLIYRKKIGFAAPTTRWFKSSNLFNEKLNDLFATKTGWADLFDVQAIKDLQQRNRTDASVDYSYHLWAIQNLLAHEYNHG